MTRTGGLRMKVRNGALPRFSRAQHPLPFQSRALEIPKNGQVQAADTQIPDHLRYVRLGEGRNHVRSYDHGIVNNQIGNKIAD